VAEARCARRWYLLSALGAEHVGDIGLASAWRAKQLAQPGTNLPSTFPFLALLQSVGYRTVEDLAGADFDELERTTELPTEHIEAVLKALEVLTSEDT
jgi:hypothetical protein